MNDELLKKRRKIEFDFIDGKITEQEAIEQYIALGIKPSNAKILINNIKSDFMKAKYNLK